MNDKYGTVHAADIGGVVKFLPGQQAHVGQYAKGRQERRFDDQASDGASGGEMDRRRAPKGTSERDNLVRRDMQCARHVFVRRVYVFVERLFGGCALASPVATIVVGEDGKTRASKLVQHGQVVAQVLGIAVAEEQCVTC